MDHSYQVGHEMEQVGPGPYHGDVGGGIGRGEDGRLVVDLPQAEVPVAHRHVHVREERRLLQRHARPRVVLDTQSHEGEEKAQSIACQLTIRS